MFPGSEPIPLRPIGHILTDVPDEEVGRRRREMCSEIVILPELVPALTGLAAYSHLIVLFWMDRSPPFDQRVAPAHGDPARPPVGAFAMRTRNRPNPIGLAVVDLIAIEGHRLQVRRLDAWNGTPVLDLKPYDYYDLHTDIVVPEWSNSARGRPRAP